MSEQDRAMMDIKAYLDEKRQLIEAELSCLPLSCDELSRHEEAMRYSLMAGGKRLRPILFLATTEALQQCPLPFLSLACALECIHTYSLIHDDLPAMDNDDLRRGKPTNHKVFGEAAAILAGDGLLTKAFDLLSDTTLAPELGALDRIRIIHLVARAAGTQGMVGGQALDVVCEGKEISFDTLRRIHATKTGALITASVQCGAIAGGATPTQFKALTAYGEAIGLAFQMVDDLLNVIGDPKLLGKATGSDAARKKATYPAFFGVDETREKIKKTIDEALTAIMDFGVRAQPLRELARYIHTRKK